MKPNASFQIQNRLALYEQKRWGNPQCYRQAFNVVDRDIPHLALHMGDEGSMKTCLMGKLFLRPAALSAQTLQIGGEKIPGISV